MDTGQFYVPLVTEVAKLPAITNAKDMNQIIDLYVAHEGAWHTGSHPVQTFLSCVYIEDMLTSICSMSDDPQASLFVDVLKQELAQRIEAKKQGSSLSSSSEDKPASPSSLPKIVRPSSPFGNNQERISKYKAELESHFSAADLYYLLTLSYLLGATKTADLCSEQYRGARSFVYADEDIGLTLFDLTLFSGAKTNNVQDVLTLAQSLLELDLEDALKLPEPTNGSSQPSKSKAKSKSKSKGKSKPQRQQQSNSKPASTPSDDLKSSILRFKLRSKILQVLGGLPKLETEQTFADALSTVAEILLDIPSSSSSKKSKFNVVFSKGFQSRCNNFNPVRELTTLTINDGYTTQKSIFQTINTFRTLIQMANSTDGGGSLGAQSKASGNLRAFFVAFGGSKPTLPITTGSGAGQYTQPLPIARAALHNITYDAEKREILGEPVLEWLLRDMKEISAAPYLRVLFNNSEMLASDRAKNDNLLAAVDNIRPQIDMFLMEAQLCYVELLYAFVCNRSRQRQMISHTIIMWDSLEVSAQQLEDLIFAALTEAGEPLEQYIVSQTGENDTSTSTQRAFPLVWWAGIRRMFCIEWVILMGFELDIYKPWEFAYMYEYAEEVVLEILGYLNESNLYISDAKEFRKLTKLSNPAQDQVPLYKGDPATLYQDIDGASAYIQSLVYEQQIIRELCTSQRRLVEAGYLLGYITRPGNGSQLTSVKLQHGLRMKPFSSIGYPAPPALHFPEDGEKDDKGNDKPFLPFRLDGDDAGTTQQARVNKRLKLARAKGMTLCKVLGNMLQSYLSNNSAPSAASPMDQSAAEDLKQLKKSAENVAVSAERLEKHLKSKTRKALHVDVVSQGCNPWFPAVNFNGPK